MFEIIFAKGETLGRFTMALPLLQEELGCNQVDLAVETSKLAYHSPEEIRIPKQFEIGENKYESGIPN
jgi:hypothetical protein